MRIEKKIFEEELTILLLIVENYWGTSRNRFSAVIVQTRSTQSERVFAKLRLRSETETKGSFLFFFLRFHGWSSRIISRSAWYGCAPSTKRSYTHGSRNLPRYRRLSRKVMASVSNERDGIPRYRSKSGHLSFRLKAISLLRFLRKILTSLPLSLSLSLSSIVDGKIVSAFIIVRVEDNFKDHTWNVKTRERKIKNFEIMLPSMYLIIR